MTLSQLKEKLNVKKLMALVIAIIIVYQLLSAIIISESFLNREEFAESERGASIISQPLSSVEQIEWLKSASKKPENQVTDFNGVAVKNIGTSHSYMILLHSLTTSVEDMASYAYHFYDLGFNIYIPDYIEGFCTMGINESGMVFNMINSIVEEDSKASVFVFGIGTGGATAILTCVNALPNNVKGVIADSTYSDAGELFKENIKDVYGVSAYPRLWISSAYVKLTRGWSFSEAQLLSAARGSEKPILYIHGTEDSVVPVNQSNELFEVTRAKGSDHVTIHGADHLQGLNTDSEKYWREVDEFIRNSMDF